MSSAVRHVLLDADGVLQDASPDWRERLATYSLGDTDDLIREVLLAELAPLRGEGDFMVALAQIVDRRQLPTTAEELHHAGWGSIDQVPSSLEVVHRLRTAGYGVHLGTNQHAQRAAYMRQSLGYDALFDISVYSCDIGFKKPDPAYFERALELIVARPDEVLFVDDREDNVLAARSVGLAAERWEHVEGLPALQSRLAAHGVTLDR